MYTGELVVSLISAQDNDISEFISREGYENKDKAIITRETTFRACCQNCTLYIRGACIPRTDETIRLTPSIKNRIVEEIPPITLVYVNKYTRPSYINVTECALTTLHLRQNSIQ